MIEYYIIGALFALPTLFLLIAARGHDPDGASLSSQVSWLKRAIEGKNEELRAQAETISSLKKEKQALADSARAVLVSTPAQLREAKEEVEKLKKELHKKELECRELAANLKVEKEKHLIDPPPLILDPMPASGENEEDLREQIKTLEDTLAALYHGSVTDRRLYTWGEILRRRGRGRFDLSEADRLSIHYPIFNPARVYYAPAAGRRYHAVRWCYALDATQNVTECTQATARRIGLSPCSLCIDLPEDDLEAKT